jgi:PilZ domain
MAVEPKSSLSKPRATRFVLRPYRRIPTWLVLYYLSGECVGKGVVTNLSRSGMRVQGDHTVEPGLDLTLRVMFADDIPPIEINRATVRWVDGYDFGLDLVLVCPFAAKHITDALSQQIRAPQSST